MSNHFSAAYLNFPVGAVGVSGGTGLQDQAVADAAAAVFVGGTA